MKKARHFFCASLALLPLILSLSSCAKPKSVTDLPEGLFFLDSLTRRYSALRPVYTRPLTNKQKFLLSFTTAKTAARLKRKFIPVEGDPFVLIYDAKVTPQFDGKSAVTLSEIASAAQSVMKSSRAPKAVMNWSNRDFTAALTASALGAGHLGKDRLNKALVESSTYIASLEKLTRRDSSSYNRQYGYLPQWKAVDLGVLLLGVESLSQWANGRSNGIPKNIKLAYITGFDGNPIYSSFKGIALPQKKWYLLGLNQMHARRKTKMWLNSKKTLRKLLVISQKLPQYRTRFFWGGVPVSASLWDGVSAALKQTGVSQARIPVKYSSEQKRVAMLVSEQLATLKSKGSVSAKIKALSPS